MGMFRKKDMLPNIKVLGSLGVGARDSVRYYRNRHGCEPALETQGSIKQRANKRQE